MNTLRNLTVTFGSLVDKGANPGAHILLFKRDDDAQAVAALTDAVAGVSKVGRKMAGPRMAALKVAIEHLKQILSECGGADAGDDDEKEPGMSKKNETATDPVATEAPAPVVEKADDVIAKRLADLEKRAADAEARATELAKAAQDAEAVAKAERDARLTNEYIAKAAKYGALSIEAATFGPILKRAAESLSTEDCAELERVLTAANEAVGKSALFGEIGRSGADDASSATEQLNKMAMDLIVEKKAAHYADAFTMVTKDAANRALVEAYLAEQRVRN